jgi:predicted phosphatase
MLVLYHTTKEIREVSHRTVQDQLSLEALCHTAVDKLLVASRHMEAVVRVLHHNTQAVAVEPVSLLITVELFRILENLILYK